MDIEEQRVLTAFLGDCWHDSPTECRKCNKIVYDPRCSLPYLDFTDWRVVGRLLEKLGGLHLFKLTTGVWCAQLMGQYSDNDAPTPQLAICHAVLAYLAKPLLCDTCEQRPENCNGKIKADGNCFEYTIPLTCG